MARTVKVSELARLGVRSACDPEMALGEIKGLVSLAAEAEGVLADDDAISAEAERIWTSFGDLRAPGLESARVYDVDGRTGEVRDWRRPDPGRTPDRGDVTAVHTVSDEPRFSGGGTADEEVSPLIPSDQDFSGRLYREAPELAQLASDLIERHGYLEHLEHCQVRYFWKRKTGVQKGQRQTGGLRRGSDLLGHLLGADFAIWLAADTARERRFSPRRVERSLFRQLRRIGQDDNGNWIELPFTLQVFTEEIAEYADVGDDDLRIGHSAFKNADQLGLFAVDQDGEEDEDDDEPDTAGEGPTDEEIDEVRMAEEDRLAEAAMARQSGIAAED